MTLDENAQSLKNIERYLEILVRFNYFEIKKKAISTELEEKIFELTGSLNRDDICEKLKISPNTVSDLWSQWLDFGLIMKQGNSYKKTVR